MRNWTISQWALAALVAAAILALVLTAGCEIAVRRSVNAALDLLQTGLFQPY